MIRIHNPTLIPTLIRYWVHLYGICFAQLELLPPKGARKRALAHVANNIDSHKATDDPLLACCFAKRALRVTCLAARLEGGIQKGIGVGNNSVIQLCEVLSRTE